MSCGIDQSIMSVTLNPAGDWIAFGCEHLGQLLVWEWQSETYVLKQQGHFNSMACVAYSTDGGTIATGKLLRLGFYRIGNVSIMRQGRDSFHMYYS